MGCTASKLHNDDTVKRCKERRRLMSAAVSARHHLSTAHSDYCRSLRFTGSALAAFASGNPAAVLNRAATAPAAAPTGHSPPPPPPRVHHHSPVTQPPPPSPRRRKAMKLPHILSSSSSFSSTPPPPPPPPPRNFNFTYSAGNIRANSTTYSTTPTQSSAWNWDSFYPPPSPPDSEYFDKLKNTRRDKTYTAGTDHEDGGDDHSDDDTDSTFTKNSTYIPGVSNDGVKNRDYVESYFDDKASSIISKQHSHDHSSGAEKFDDHGSNHSFNARRSEEEYGRNDHTRREYESEREELQCSEWGDHDHCSTTSGLSDEDLDSKSSAFRTRASRESERFDESGNVRNRTPNSNVSSKSDKASAPEEEEEEDDDDDDHKSNYDKMIVVRHNNFVEIANVLKEHFDKASSSGDQVSEMLETGRAQLDRSFKQLRKTIYHSTGVLSNLSSSWTSKPPLAVKYRFEPASIEHRIGPKSLCSTLDRLLAWEKKLYQDVKAREGVKIEHEKKLSTLQSQEYRSEEESKLNKTKASIKRLQSLITATSQAVSTTSSAITGLRDSDLVPQLIELCHGFMYMWRTMHQTHENQNSIVQQIRGLTNDATNKTEPTSDHHRQATSDLESALSYWHSSFCRVIKYLCDFVRSLLGWFRLTQLPVTHDPTSNDPKHPYDQMSEVFAFFDEWKLALDRVPDTVAYEAIVSLNNVIHSISSKQTEEFKIQKRAEKASRVLEKKASYIKKMEKVYYHSPSYSTVGVVEHADDDNGHLLDTRDPLADKKAELLIYQRRADDEMVKYFEAIEVTKAMTLHNIQTGLPGVFQAMTSFSALMSEALETACTKSYAI